MRTANEVRDAMIQAGMSMQEMANRTGLSYQKVWNKLNGRTALSESDIERMARALGAPARAAAPSAKAAEKVRTAPAAKRSGMSSDGLRFAIVASRWNELVTKELVEGALDELARHGDAEVRVVRVPGAWEIPLAARAAAAGKWRPHAILALGCVLQGQTPHAAMLGGEISSALMSLQLSTGVPVAWGILTPDSQEQALDRGGLKMGNKGREAAQAAIEMANLVGALG